LSTKLVAIINDKSNEEVLKASAAGAVSAMAITTQGKQNFYNLGALKACAEMLNAERTYLFNFAHIKLVFFSIGSTFECRHSNNYNW